MLSNSYSRHWLIQVGLLLGYVCIIRVYVVWSCKGLLDVLLTDNGAVPFCIGINSAVLPGTTSH